MSVDLPANFGFTPTATGVGERDGRRAMGQGPQLYRRPHRRHGRNWFGRRVPEEILPGGLRYDPPLKILHDLFVDILTELCKVK
jgi:hypothetical protein